MAAQLPPGFSRVDIPTPAPNQDVPVPANMPQGFTPVQEPDVDPDSFFGRVGTQIGKRIEKVERSVKMYEEGEITYPELALRGLGFGVGSVFDTVGEGAMTILSALTPDQVEDFLKEQIAAGGTKLMETDTAKSLLQAYQELPQRAKDNFGDIVTVGTGMLPKGQAGKKLVESGIKAEKETLAKYVLNQTPSAKEFRVREMGLPKNMQTTLNREDSILNTVVSLKGVSESSSRKKIMGSINQEIGRLAQDINKSLANSKYKYIPKQDVNVVVTKAMQEYTQKNPLFATEKFSNLRGNLQEAYRQALKEFNGKPQELLKLRQNFDKNVATLLKKDVHEGDVSREMVASIRNSLNNMMESVAPDDAIKASMRRQHNLMLAKDNLAYNMAREGSMVENTVKFINQHPFMAMSAAGGTGMIPSLLGSEVGLVGGLTAAGAYGVTRPSVRKGVGTVLSELPTTRGMLFGATNTVEEEMQGIAP